jgi:hypothetical protein
MAQGRLWIAVCKIGYPQRKVERQVKVLSKHLAVFFLLPSKKFLPISFKIQLLETSAPKQKEQRQKQLDVSSLTIYILPSLSV